MKKINVLAFSGALLAACGPSISYDRDATIPIPTGATYVLASGANVGEERDAALQSQIVHQRIQNSIHAQMAAKGFKLAASEAAADFKVRYAIGVKTEVSYQTTSMGGYGGWYGYGWGYGGGSSSTYPVESKTGGAAIDLVTTKGDRLAWRGMIKGSAGEKAPSQEKVDSRVTEIMKSLVPGK
jgi:hypothetical protein